MVGLLPIVVGLDPGTANTLLYVKGRGVAVDEPSPVTVRTSTGAIEAVGGDAEAGRGRTPRKLQAARPITAGIVNDHRLFRGMLQWFLRKAHVAGSLHRLKVVIAIPGSMTEVERRETIESLRNAGAADVILVDQGLAAGLGAGLPIDGPRGRVVVNIGAGVARRRTVLTGVAMQDDTDWGFAATKAAPQTSPSGTIAPNDHISPGRTSELRAGYLS